MLLEKEHDNFSSENHLRQQSEKLLEETKELHDKTVKDAIHQRKQGLERWVLQSITSCFFPLVDIHFIVK